MQALRQMSADGFDAEIWPGWESEDVDVPFHGRNLWPAAESLPDYRRVLTEYNTALTAVADRSVYLVL